MDEQSQNAHDELTNQDQFRMSHHITTSPQERGGFIKEVWPPPEEGASRLPNTGSASAYPCAEDIIACFVEFGKVRNCLPPPRGKVPPQGADEGFPGKKEIPRRGIGD